MKMEENRWEVWKNWKEKVKTLKWEDEMRVVEGRHHWEASWSSWHRCNGWLRRRRHGLGDISGGGEGGIVIHQISVFWLPSGKCSLAVMKLGTPSAKRLD